VQNFAEFMEVSEMGYINGGSPETGNGIKREKPIVRRAFLHA
jgi:hypothetical protein